MLPSIPQILPISDENFTCICVNPQIDPRQYKVQTNQEEIKFFNFQIKNINGFINSKSDFINQRLKEVHLYLDSTGKQDRLGLQDDKTIITGIIGELLFVQAIKQSKLVDKVNGLYDVEYGTFKIDVKTKATEYSSLEIVKNSKYSDTYLLNSQCHEGIYYVFCHYDRTNDRAVFFMNKELEGSNINKLYPPEWKNPPFTSRELQFNHIIPIGRVYS